MSMELLTDAHFWVGVAFVVFLGVLVMAGVHKFAWSALGEAGRKVQAQLDEAESLRREAQTLLSQITEQRAEAERVAAATVEAARDEARRLQAEAQATADVKAAAADLAAQMAEQVLTTRLAGAKSDPLIDQALGQLGSQAFSRQ